MIIKAVTIKNFRCIQLAELSLDSLTALVGANGSGKSTVLQAIELFYSQSPKIGPEDIYANDAAQEIEIAVTFTKLEMEAKKEFESYLEGDELNVARVFSGADLKRTGRYHGNRMQNLEFAAIRAASGARDKRPEYNKLREGNYTELPAWTKLDDVEPALRKWEIDHPDRCKRIRDDGQFFGYRQVGHGRLEKYTRFVMIPAVREASEDALDGKGSVIAELMDIVVGNALANQEDMARLRQDTQARYNKIVDPEKLGELRTLADSLSGTLKTYIPQADVALKWIKTDDIDLPMPKADVKLIEDGYESPVNRTGHGLQRAFVLTMLQHLAVARAADPTEEAGQEPPETGEAPPSAKLPDLLLAIEEPELYQHPNRQRHFAQILMNLATGTTPGVAEHTQVLYCTHSPLFVGVDRLDQVRLLRKQLADASKPKTTKLIQASLDKVANDLRVAKGKTGDSWTRATLRPRLQAIMTPWMNEGFFADVVVLVEGEVDRAAILAQAALAGEQLERDGFAIIPCMGKKSIDRPLLIFRNLGIPAYVVWDGDFNKRDANPDDNRYMLRLVSQAEVEWPMTVVQDNYACFRTDIETTLREEIGEDSFDGLIRDIGDEFGIMGREQQLKNPVVMAKVISQALQQGKKSKTLQEILSKIRLLKAQETRAS